MMNIREQLLLEHSKHNSLKIIQFIGNNQARFDELFALFIENENIIAQRAAYSVGHVFDVQPQLVEKHLSTLVNNMSSQNLHDAIIRCTVRILQGVDLPKHLQGMAIDQCYKLYPNQIGFRII